MSSNMASEESPDRILNAIAEYTPRHVEQTDSSPAAVLILVSEREGEPHAVSPRNPCMSLQMRGRLASS